MGDGADKVTKKTNGLSHRVLQPKSWPEPRGYANGVSARGQMIFTGGLVGWDAAGNFPSDFIGQVRQVLRNTIEVLRAGGAGPEHIVRMTWYVTDMDAYLGSLKELGAAYQEVMGRSYPAMALVEVVRLVEPAAKVEIETTAVLPES
jgi:enamine deaminase RidA (YjgF/YER057c/UK114 family)